MSEQTSEKTAEPRITQNAAEPTKSFELTQADQSIVLYALGGLLVRAGMDENRKLSGFGLRIHEVARKVGITS